MAYVLKNEFVSEELEKEIAAAIRERRSVEQLLEEKGFTGTSPEAIEELTHILIKCMGAAMALEFIFTANLERWENYRNELNELWEKISESEDFNSKINLLLGQSLYQRGKKVLGVRFIRKASQNPEDFKTAIAVAEAVNHEIGNESWIRDILLIAKEMAKTADEYAKISLSFIDLIEDKDEGKKAIDKAVRKAHTFVEFCTTASIILKAFGDKEWAEVVFEIGAHKKDASSALDTLAEEEYKENLAAFDKKQK